MSSLVTSTVQHRSSLDHDAASVGRIADNIGEYGTGGSGGMAEDEVIRECLRIIVDAKARQK